MTQDEKWLLKYNEVVAFIENNKRNPSKHDDEERGLYLNWIKHNRKLYSAGLLTNLHKLTQIFIFRKHRKTRKGRKELKQKQEKLLPRV